MNKIYLLINNIPKYLEIESSLDSCYIFDKKTSLYFLINDPNSSCRLGRDDGPAIKYHNGPSIFRSTKSCYKFFYKSENHYSNEYINLFKNETNHLLCQSCNDFCNQKCFL